MRGQARVAPLHGFGHDAGVPCAARSRNCPRDVVGEDAWQHQLAPPLPAAYVKVGSYFAVVVGVGAGSCNHVKQDVPLRTQHHQGREPNIGVEVKAHNKNNKCGKQQVGRESRQKLRQRLDFFSQLGAQPNQHAHRHPYQRSQRNQHNHTQQGDAAKHKHMPHFGQRNVCANVKHNAVHRIHGKREQRAAPEPIEQLCFLGSVKTGISLGGRCCFYSYRLRVVAAASRAQPQRDTRQP